ncbi:MAG TPA: glycosyltransferase family 4 protein [Acidimicrobiia bacterium]|nr:glycosyltransferase family 4 protein [Acidimicrobiia bacterium]
MPGRVLIVVQNLPVPFDRRVWLESQTLKDAGIEVHVVCPKGPGDPTHEVVDGIALHKYRPPPAGSGIAGYIVEYTWSFVMTAWLTAREFRGGRFDVLQSCNPPDIFWPLGLLFRTLTGCRYVYDQHDLCPELYESRFPDGSAVAARVLRLLERLNYRTADHVIATNNSYRKVALERGGKAPDSVTVVRTGPDAERLRRVTPDPARRRDHRYLVAYIGVMGPQDGVDNILRAAHEIVHGHGRHDIAFTIMGGGDCFESLVTLRDELGLRDHVELTGRVPDDVVARVLSTADLGLSPDPRNPLNDVSTMNKTMEYMAFELPVVAFDLIETRVSGGPAAVYVEPNRIDGFAQAILDLLADEPRRQWMGALGRRRIEDELAWSHQGASYLSVYERMFGLAPRREERAAALAAGD